MRENLRGGIANLSFFLSLTLVVSVLILPFRLAGGDSSVQRFDRHPAPDRRSSRRRSKNCHFRHSSCFVPNEEIKWKKLSNFGRRSHSEGERRIQTLPYPLFAIHTGTCLILTSIGKFRIVSRDQNWSSAPAPLPRRVGRRPCAWRPSGPAGSCRCSRRCCSRPTERSHLQMLAMSVKF